MLVAVCKTQTADKEHEWADIAQSAWWLLADCTAEVSWFDSRKCPVRFWEPPCAVQCVKKVIFSGVKKPESGTKNLVQSFRISKSIFHSPICFHECTGTPLPLPLHVHMNQRLQNWAQKESGSTYVGCWKSIRTTAVIPATVNLLQWWTNHFRSNTIVTRTYSSGV